MVYEGIRIHMKSIERMLRMLLNLPAGRKIESGQVDILILDEINNAINLRLVDLPQLLAIIKSKPPLMHLVLTGRDAHPEIIELADTVSEVNEIKHAYRKEIEPQPGIDY